MEGASKTNDFKTHGPYCVEHVISAGGPGAAAAASKGGWRITLAGRGAAKGSTRIATKVEKVTPLGKVEVWGFRQDSLATMLPNTEVPQCIVSIADGHGPSVPGQLMSQSSHLKMLPRVASVAGEILQWLRDGNIAAVEQNPVPGGQALYGRPTWRLTEKVVLAAALYLRSGSSGRSMVATQHQPITEVGVVAILQRRSHVEPISCH